MVVGPWYEMLYELFSISPRILKYGTLLNLLDNYMSLALASYNIHFKLTRLDDYFYAVVMLWIMFFVFAEGTTTSPPSSG